MKTQRISPAALTLLKDALTLAFWYRNELRGFVTTCLPDNQLIPRLDWTGYKRNIVGTLVDTMARDQHIYFDDLLELLIATSEISDPQHLRRVEDGEKKYADAVRAIAALKAQVKPYVDLRSKEEEQAKRRIQQQALAAQQRAVVEKLGELKQLFHEMVKLSAQERGYALEKLLNQLFALYDIDAKGPFKIVGEQIDGGFTLEDTDFLLEARWKQGLTEPKELRDFIGKVNSKLDNTLGLFISINGYEPTAKALNSGSRPVLILLDGADLMIALDDRIAFPQLLLRKKQHAARTGETFIDAATIIG
ncbi:hypothetical protein TM7_0001 [candidate division TM7 genomosp. GTL1]|nr:hypothetical protein TM7_0001 [candidate division TM7 genomosp. GTL1]